MEALLHRTSPLAFASSSDYVPKHSGASAAETETPQEDPEGGPKRHRALKIAIAVVVALLAAGYGAGAWAFSYVCYPGTTVLGADLTLLDATQAAQAIDEAVGAYALTVSGDDFSWTYEPGSADEVVDSPALAQQVIDDNDPLLWPVHLVEALLGQRSYDDPLADATSADLTSSFGLVAFTESLNAAIEEYNAQRTGVFDPSSAYDAEENAFTLEQARANELLDAEAVLADALTAVARLESTLELGEDHRVALADGATDEEIQAVCDAANALIGASLTLLLGETEVATLDSDQIFAWITFGDDLTASLDDDALTAWVEELADSLDTVGTERTYTRGDGEVITVSGGTFGWEVDVDAFVEAVQTAVAEGQTTTLSIPTTSEGDVYTAQGEADWGAYIDVDISEQYARFYDADGNIVWESGVITSNTTKGYVTPSGVYYIRSMYRNITLRGPYDSETDTYEWESDVSYWMAFVGSSIGFHDATWQNSSNFGVPGANTWTGSHGCVNLPLSAAEELYDLVYLGLCVVVHE